MLGRRSLLGREDVSRVEEARLDVAGDVERDRQRRRDRLDRADAAVGGGHASHRHDDPLSAFGDRGGNELSDAAARRGQRVVPLRSAGEREPAGERCLDDRHAAVLEAPLCFDRFAERPRDGRPPVAAAEYVERSLPAVRKRKLGRCPACACRSGSDCRRGFARAERAAELVRSGEKVHHVEIVATVRPVLELERVPGRASLRLPSVQNFRREVF